MTLERGLSDFHKMALTVIKVFYKKKANDYTTYRSYKNVSMPDNQNRISQVTSENNHLEFDLFKAVLNEAIQKHTPIKQRYVRANQAPFINKTINKNVMKRSRLRKKKNLTQKVTLRGKRTMSNVIFVGAYLGGKRKTFLLILVRMTS